MLNGLKINKRSFIPMFFIAGCGGASASHEGEAEAEGENGDGPTGILTVITEQELELTDTFEIRRLTPDAEFETLAQGVPGGDPVQVELSAGEYPEDDNPNISGPHEEHFINILARGYAWITYPSAERFNDCAESWAVRVEMEPDEKIVLRVGFCRDLSGTWLVGDRVYENASLLPNFDESLYKIATCQDRGLGPATLVITTNEVAYAQAGTDCFGERARIQETEDGPTFELCGNRYIRQSKLECP